MNDSKQNKTDILNVDVPLPPNVQDCISKFMDFKGKFQSEQRSHEGTSKEFLCCGVAEKTNNKPERNAEQDDHTEILSVHSPVNVSEAFLIQNSSINSPHFFIREHFLGRSTALDLKQASLSLLDNAHLKPAGTGRGLGFQIDRSVRGDSFAWIDPADPEVPAPFRSFRNAVKTFIHGLAKLAPALDLTPTISMQLAFYPGDGTGYVRHRDAFQASSSNDNKDKFSRKVTCVYYLNDAWEESQGGKLRLYYPDIEGNENFYDVCPSFDKMVIFRSDLVDHEVLPAFCPRFALTCWFHCKEPNDEANAAFNLTILQPKENSSAQDRKKEHTLNPRVDYGPVSNVDNRSNVPSLPVKDSPEHSHSKQVSIFVSIISYRDTECQHTVLDLFERAQNPSRVFIGVVHQLNLCGDEDKDCISVPLPASYKNQVRSIYLNHTEAKGPCWARHLAQSLWQGEEYFLQLDSHMRFRPNWDSYLVQTLLNCPSVDPVLTAYPPGYTLPHKISVEDLRPVLICPKEFIDGGILTSRGRRLTKVHETPIPSPLWAAGFSFSRSDMILRVPYDPFLPFLFFGEEISMAARLWTHGYDLFCPPEVVIFHLWSRSHRPSFREIKPSADRAQAELCSKLRVLQILALEPSVHASLGLKAEHFVHSMFLEKYGLGEKRTICEFWKYLGIQKDDNQNLQISDFGMNGNLSADEFDTGMIRNEVFSQVMKLMSEI